MLYLYLAYWTTSGRLSGEQLSLLNQAFSSLSTFFCDFFDSYCKSLQKRLGITINAIVQGRRERGVLPIPWGNSFRLQPPPPPPVMIVWQRSYNPLSKISMNITFTRAQAINSLSTYWTNPSVFRPLIKKHEIKII